MRCKERRSVASQGARSNRIDQPYGPSIKEEVEAERPRGAGQEEESRASKERGKLVIKEEV